MPAHGGNARHVGMHKRGQAVPVVTDGERILSHKERLIDFHPRFHHRRGDARLPHAGDASVGIDADLGMAGGGAHLDVGDFDLAEVGGSEALEGREDAGEGKRQSSAEKFSSLHDLSFWDRGSN